MYEYDREVVIDILENISWALEQIQKRFTNIDHAEDFVDSDSGLEKLDGICMQLLNIGEALKRIDKITERNLLKGYPQIEWKKVKGMRDIITHHYFDIDAGTVFTVCDEHVPQLQSVIKLIRKDIEN